MSLKIKQIKQLCWDNINQIFQDLEDLDFIDADSKFYSASKEQVYHTCFQSLYPLLEFFKDDYQYNDFIFKNTELFVYSYFLDEALDSTKVPSRVAQSTQISSFLLIKYKDWLNKTYTEKTIVSFLKAYTEYSHYLVLEKQWDFPDAYIREYSELKKIHQKCILLLFPVYYLLENILERKKLTLLKKIFTDFYTYNLLVDDIRDSHYDIQNKCLTYPIIQYIKLTRKYPEKTEDLKILHHKLIKETSYLYQNIYTANHLNKKFSKIIDMALIEQNKAINGGE